MATIRDAPLSTLSAVQSVVTNTLGFAVSKQLIATILSRGGLTRKKARFYGQPKDLEAKTRGFLDDRASAIASGSPIVSIDETSFGRHTGPAFGYSKRGTKVFVRKNATCVKTSTVVACVAAEGLVHRKTMTGSCNTSRFVEFLRECNLPKGTVVLLDNVSFHHAREVKSFASTSGLHMLFVPPYSPWFNPVEGCFSVVKRAFYRGLAIDDAFATLSSSHCEAFFRRSLSTIERF